MPAVVELIEHHRTRGPKSLEFVVSTENRSLLRIILAIIKQLSRYNVQDLFLEDRAEGNVLDAARAKIMTLQRKKKGCCRHCHVG